MEFLRDFANNDWFMLFGLASTLFALFVTIYAGYLILAGVLPVLYRLGKGLSNREICIFSENEIQYSSLKDLLVDSNIFKEKNIRRVHKNDISKVKGKSIFLVYWKDFENDFQSILDIKEDSTALIIYAPQEDGFIDKDNMKKINNERNAVVVNFRGRLLNDILTSLMTTAYKNDKQ